MAIAESVNVPSIMPSGRPMRYISVDTNPAQFGAGVGQALSQVGASISDATALIDANNVKIRSEQAKVAANNAFIDASLKKGQADADFYTTTGTQAAAAYPAYNERLAAIRKEALDGLDTDEAKKLFDDDFQTQLISGINGGATHAAKEHKSSMITSAEQRLLLIQQDSSTKFADDELFAKNLGALDRMVSDLGSVQGWDSVTVLNKQFEQRSLAWKYRITAMANSDPAAAQGLFNEVRDGLAAGDRIEIQNTVTSALNNRGAADLVNGILNPGAANTFYPSPTFRQSIAESGLPANVRVAIADGTSLAGMQPKAIQILHGAAAAAAELGITLNITAAEGGGHLSHGQGTEWDLKGYHGDGRLWTPAERAYIARGSAAAGADRFGLYSYGAGYRGNGSLHVGYSGDGRPAAVWGASGFTSGAESRNFSDADERQFLRDFGAGGLAAVRGVGAGSLRDRIIYAEGGGAGIVSHKNAMGVMQLKPETAAEVAAGLGLPFDVYRLKYDAEYNVLLGTTYLNQMLEMFQGDEMLAAAAYNAGPSRVWKWLKENGDPRNGTISHAEWAALIPFEETRGYVNKVMTGNSVGGGTFGQGGGVPAPTAPGGFAIQSQEDFATVLARARAQAEMLAPGNSIFANQVVSEVQTQWNLQNKAIEEARAANYDDVVGEAMDGDSSGNLPTSREELLTNPELKERWDALDNTQKKAIDSILAQNAGTIEPDPTEALREFERIYGLYNTDKTGFAKEDIAGNSKLTKEYRKELIGLRVNPPKDSPDVTYSLKHALDLAGTLIVGNAVELDAAKYNQFAGALTMRLEEYVRDNQKKPDDQAIREIVGELLRETATENNSYLWGVIGSIDHTYAFENAQPFASEVIDPAGSAIPEAIRAELIKRYQQSHSGQMPSEALIQQMYIGGTKPKAPEVPQ